MSCRGTPTPPPPQKPVSFKAIAKTRDGALFNVEAVLVLVESPEVRKAIHDAEVALREEYKPGTDGTAPPIPNKARADEESYQMLVRALRVPEDPRGRSRARCSSPQRPAGPRRRAAHHRLQRVDGVRVPRHDDDGGAPAAGGRRRGKIRARPALAFKFRYAEELERWYGRPARTLPDWMVWQWLAVRRAAAKFIGDVEEG